MVNSELVIVIRFFFLCVVAAKRRPAKCWASTGALKVRPGQHLAAMRGPCMPVLCMLCSERDMWIREKQPKEQGAGVAACGENESGTPPCGEEARSRGSHHQRAVCDGRAERTPRHLLEDCRKGQVTDYSVVAL